MQYHPRKSPCRPTYVFAPAARRRGITLLETALTTIIVGLAITALVKLVIVTTQQDVISQRTTAGSLLAENLREMMAGLPFADPSRGTTTFGPETGETAITTYNDVDDFDNFDSATRPDIASGQPVGVIDAARRVMTDPLTNQVPAEWANYRQQIAVDPVDPANLNSVLPKTLTNRTVVRITVTVSYRPASATAWTPVATLRWIKAR